MRFLSICWTGSMSNTNMALKQIVSDSWLCTRGHEHKGIVQEIYPFRN